MIVTILWYFLICSIYINGQELYDCDSEIFCRGDILETIQLSDPPVYKSSADFVEMRLKNSPKDIVAEFESIKSSFINDKNLLKSFAFKNFEPDSPDKCSNFENKKMPALETRVENKRYQQFVSSISEMWSKLIVQTSDHVKDKPEYHSLVYLPKCFVKSDEFTSTTNYYDNYWILRGLLANGMSNIAAGIIENYAYLIRKHSFVLHSNRVYSSKRTQMPLLALMMENYQSETKDSEFLLKNLEAMETEFLWWTENRYFQKTIRKKQYKVFQFHQTGDKPRPEVYKEDHKLARKVYREDHKKYFFSSIRALDETGLGFSSRFKRNLTRTWASMNVMDLIPVELNSVLHRYAFLLAKWFKDTKKDIIAGKKYEKFARNIANVINNVLWNERKHMWLDWDLTKKRHKSAFSPTNLMPLFTMSYPEHKAAEYSDYALKYLQSERIIDADFKPHYWIIPTSTIDTEAVWDFPYGSPPQNLFIIKGLMATLQDKAYDVALELTKVLVKTIFVAHDKDGTLYKQYSAVNLGKGVNERIGSKISQAGYAWTNGAVLTLFEWYGQWLQPGDYREFKPYSKDDNSADEKKGKRKRGTAVMIDDDEYEPPSLSQQPSQQILKRKGSKLSKNSESESSSFEITPVGRIKKQISKEKGEKSTKKNESEQPLNEPSSSKQRPKKNLERKASKPSDEVEPPPNEAAKSEQPARKRRRRRKSKKSDQEESEPPSNEATVSEQPRKRKIVRKASKQFVVESEPSSEETSPPEQTTKKKRRIKFSKLSDYESEPPSNEINLTDQFKNRRKRKSSKPKKAI